MKQDDLEPREFPSAASCCSARAASASSLAAVGDRAGQVGRHPAPVMDQQPPRGQRLRQARGQAGLVRQCPDQRYFGVRSGSCKDFDTLISQFRSTSY
jgi:hypothetical protein